MMAPDHVSLIWEPKIAAWSSKVRGLQREVLEL